MLDSGLLAELVNAPSPSGFEERVRSLIVKRLRSLGLEPLIDNIGNVYVILGEDKPSLILAAHMDEVGVMVRYIDDNGFIRFTALGGLNPLSIIGHEVILLAGEDMIPGVIGSNPPHIQGQQAPMAPTIEDLFIDIGASSRQEVLDYGISPGTPGTFPGNFKETKKHVFGKALDDRVGCYALLKAVEDVSPPDHGSVVVAFTVQEEVGLRGASVLAKNLEPNFAIAVEGTIANDVPLSSPDKVVTRLGAGPAIRVMDRSIIGSQRLLNHIKKLLAKKDIPFQLQLSPYSATDSGSFLLWGAEVTAVSVPVRYIHAPVSMALKSDIDFTVQALKEIISDPFPV
ncbi:MAG: M42 family metallopeptidase [Infirmifilum sp.]